MRKRLRKKNERKLKERTGLWKKKLSNLEERRRKLDLKFYITSICYCHKRKWEEKKNSDKICKAMLYKIKRNKKTP